MTYVQKEKRVQNGDIPKIGHIVDPMLGLNEGYNEGRIRDKPNHRMGGRMGGRNGGQNVESIVDRIGTVQWTYCTGGMGD